MSHPDLSRLTPADAAVALRSFDRRFRAAVRPVDDPQVETWARVPGPDGRSATDHVVAAGQVMVLLHQALRRVLTADDPLLEAGVTDAAERTPPGREAPLDVGLDALAEAAGALADLADSVPSADWGRSGRVPGPERVEALDVVKEAVRSGLAHLDGAGQAMDHARAD